MLYGAAIEVHANHAVIFRSPFKHIKYQMGTQLPGIISLTVDACISASVCRESASITDLTRGPLHSVGVDKNNLSRS